MVLEVEFGGIQGIPQPCHPATRSGMRHSKQQQEDQFGRQLSKAYCFVLRKALPFTLSLALMVLQLVSSSGASKGGPREVTNVQMLKKSELKQIFFSIQFLKNNT